MEKAENKEEKPIRQKFSLIKYFKQRIELLKNDKSLLKLFFCHIILIVLHYAEYRTSDIEYFWYLRASGCALISVLIFFLGRKGLAYGLFIFGCSLVYVNMFYNYATIFFIYIAIGANPKLKKATPFIYLINVIVSFSMKHLNIIAFCIHIVYTIMFGIKLNYVYAVNKPSKLNLTDDEIRILKELQAGKMQKQIEFFSPQTVTAKLKSARERNMCETTQALLAKFELENQSE